MTIQFEKIPVRWDNTGAEPSEDLKTNGFQAGQKPPAQIFNFIQNNTSACLSELQTILSEIGDDGIKGIRGNGKLIKPDSSNIVNLNPSNLGSVPTYRTINNKALSSDITFNASDFGAATSATYTATLSSNSWSGSSAPYTQTVSVAGILSSDNPIVDAVLNNDISVAKEQLEAWGCVSKIITNNGNITATCYEDKPTVSIPIQLKVVR